MLQLTNNHLNFVITQPPFRYLPSEHKTFVEHLYNVSPTLKTLVQHCINDLQMFRVYLVQSFSL